MRVKASAYEGRVNIALAQLLEEAGFKEKAERRRGPGQVDVLLLYRGLRIGLEGSYDFLDAQKDAKKRIEQNLVDISVAVWYDKDVFPQEITESELKDKLKRTKQRIKIFVPGKDVTGTLIHYLKRVGRLPPRPLVYGWLTVDFPLLVQCIRQVIQYVVSEEEVTITEKKIGRFTEDFVDSLASLDENLAVCENLYETFYKLYGLSVGDYKKIKELIYAQTGLAILLSAIFYEAVRAQYKFKSLKSLAMYESSSSALTEGFNDIWNENYHPIFNVAREALLKLPPQIDPRLSELIDLACEVASKRVLLRRDFAGKIYHAIVGDWAVRKGFATYFTTVPAAYLLAHLALVTPNDEWKGFGEIEEIKNFRICDFACGSGTLLSAPYHALLYLYTRDAFKGGKDVDPEKFHKVAMEKVFWGLDALRFAVHITATTLVLHNPDVKLEDMNLYTVPLGVDSNGRICLGSLDLVDTRTPRTLIDYFSTGSFSKITPEKEVEVSIAIPKEFDLIEMNPPFTRATGRGGKAGGGLFGFITGPKIRRDVLERFELVRDNIRKDMIKISERHKFLQSLSKILGKEGLRPFMSIGQAGEGLLFLYLAHKYVRNGGRIAFVLPRSLLSGTGWFLARSLLTSKFHMEYIIVSYDAEGGYNFSESTSLSEVLLVARKVKGHNNNENTCILSLLKKPQTPLYGVQLAHEVIRKFKEPTKIDLLKHGYHAENYVKLGSTEGVVYTIPRGLLLKNLDNWGRLLAFTSPQLSLYTLNLLEGKIKLGDSEFTIPLRRLGEFAEIGIDRHQFHDSFTKVKEEAPGAYPCVYGGEESVRGKLTIKPNAFILPKMKKAKELFENFASTLLIPDRIWVDTAHVTSIYVDKPVLSNIFYAVKLKDEHDQRMLKALSLWLNSTWGILTVLASRLETRGRWMCLKMSHWRLLPVLDLTSLSEDKLDKLAGLFDKYKDMELRRLPEQFRSKQEGRLSLDLEFVKVFAPNVNRAGVRKSLLRLYEEVDKAIQGWIG